ncbi:MAG TPA: hypothetical protein VFS21_18490 [Roseiflexaceae bacterium]|nr:hypothetical protein [Roseiflexaceae bacterium]
MDRKPQRRTAQPALPPAPAEPPGKPPDEPPAEPPAHWRVLDPSWQPQQPGFFVVMQVYGTPERVLAAVEQVARGTELVLQMGTAIELPASAWDQLPPKLLTPMQQAIVREDLRNTKRTLISQRLHISPNTITAYRTQIRRRFLTLPAEARPVWIETWLRRFPGNTPSPRRNPRR